MSDQSQAMAALQALFGPEPFGSVPFTSEPSPELPTNLDDSITADAVLAWEFESFRWYSGLDTKSVQRFFKFQRGLPLKQWQELLRTQALVRVQGPYRNLQQAQTKTANV